MFKTLCNLIVSYFLFVPQEELLERPEEYQLDYEDVKIETSDGIGIHGWFFPVRDSKTALVLFHGNAGNISGRLFKAKSWVGQGLSVFMIDYRGYGKSEGTITEENDLFLDGEAAIRWLLETKKYKHSDIIVAGESLGCTVAVEFATREKFKALLLEAPFTSLKDMRKIHYPWAPEFLLQDYKLDNLSKIQKIKMPLFVLHGTLDEVCPYWMGKALYEKAPEPKEMLTIEGGRHSDLFETGGDKCFLKPCAFFGNLEKS